MRNPNCPDNCADGGGKKVKHGVVYADRNELLHALPEELVAGEFKKFPEYGDGHSKAD